MKPPWMPSSSKSRNDVFVRGPSSLRVPPSLPRMKSSTMFTGLASPGVLGPTRMRSIASGSKAMANEQAAPSMSRIPSAKRFFAAMTTIPATIRVGPSRRSPQLRDQNELMNPIPWSARVPVPPGSSFEGGGRALRGSTRSPRWRRVAVRRCSPVGCCRGSSDSRTSRRCSVRG